MKRRTYVILIVVVLLIGAAWQSLQADHGIGVDSVSWLPSAARNITYLDQPLTCRMAEFDIERRAFEDWCRAAGRPLWELQGSTSPTVFRCLPLLESRSLMAPVSEPNEFLAEQHRLDRVAVTLTNGDLYYQKRWSNGGGYTIGYDIEERRGYYWYSHH